MRLRVEKYAQLARDPKYAKYAAGWANRLRHLGASEGMANIGHNGPDNVGREFSPDERNLLALDSDGEGPPKPPGGEGGEGGEGEELSFAPGDDGDVGRVRGRVASDEGTDWLGNTVHAFTRVYGELFDPMHPIRKLVDAVTKGEPLDDYRNPNLLWRVAENASTVSKGAISGGRMVDLDGNATGHSLEDIVTGKSVGETFSKTQTRDFLNGYAVARWALMMHEQGKNPADITREDAQRVVDDYERGGTMPEGENLLEHLQRIGVAVEYINKKSSRARGGPHYDITRRKIVMPKMTDEEFRTEYGSQKLGHDEVLAHEAGHATAYTLSQQIGAGDWGSIPTKDLTLIHDELHAASRRFRPEFWVKGSGQENYVQTPSELMADAIATWLADPVARDRMPAFQGVIETAMARKEGEPFNMQN